MIPPVEDAAFAAATLGLAFAASVLETIARSSHGAATAAAWDRFQMVCSERGLSELDTAALSVWARRASLPEPANVIGDRGLFDRFVRDRVAELAALEAPGSPGRAAAISALGALRRQLGHAPAPPPTVPVSSHDAVPGVRVTVRPDPLPTGSVPPGHFVVEAADEEGLVAGALADDPADAVFYEALAPGRGCWVVFGRGAHAVFRFRSRVLARPGVDRPALFLGHGEFLLKEERRRAPRLPLRTRVRVLTVDGDASRAFDAETHDLSVGGVGLLVPAPLPRGARLAAEIALPGSAPDAGHAPGDAPVPVTLKVVGSGVRELDGTSRAYVNGQFVDLAPGTRTRISAFLPSARRLPARERALPQGSPAAHG